MTDHKQTQPISEETSHQNKQSDSRLKLVLFVLGFGLSFLVYLSQTKTAMSALLGAFVTQLVPYLGSMVVKGISPRSKIWIWSYFVVLACILLWAVQRLNRYSPLPGVEY